MLAALESWRSRNLWSPFILNEFENGSGNVKPYLKDSFNNNNNNDDDGEQKPTNSSCTSLASPKGRKDAPQLRTVPSDAMVG